MNRTQRLYYSLMVKDNRAHIILRDGHVVAVVTYLIGDDDDKYLHKRVPWDYISDDPHGETVYIDQLIVKEHDSITYIHRKFTDVLAKIKQQFPQVRMAKWVRVGAEFRKRGIKEGVKTYVHCKSIK